MIRDTRVDSAVFNDLKKYETMSICRMISHFLAIILYTNNKVRIQEHFADQLHDRCMEATHFISEKRLWIVANNIRRSQKSFTRDMKILTQIESLLFSNA